MDLQAGSAGLHLAKKHVVKHCLAHIPDLTSFRTTLGAHRARRGWGWPKGIAGSRRGLHLPKALPARWAPTGILGNITSYLAHCLKKAINSSQRATNFIYFPNMKYSLSF